MDSEITKDPSEKIKQAADEIRSWGAVAIVGAGASLQMGFPLTRQLQALLWQAIDGDPELRTQLASLHGWTGSSAKEMIGDDSARSHIASEAVVTSRSARAIYQKGFARLNNERVSRPSPAHEALSELLHRRAVEIVVSLNWDTLLEASYRRRYGRAIEADGPWLYKPHGNAAEPDVSWILPCERGFLPEALLRRIQGMSGDRPRVLLIVGYSETDENILNNLIIPLSNQWRVVRIGPSVKGDWDIKMPAVQALPSLLNSIYAETESPGWEYVNFDHQHDLGRALAGERLRPQDVLTCPRLPEVQAIKQQLTVTHSGLIIGTSGSGKSITGYQAAYDFHNDDWEVLRLVDPDRASDALLRSVANLPHRSVLLIDDAQAIGDRLTKRLLESATLERKIIAITTDEMPSMANAVRVAGSRAVNVISNALRTSRRDETLQVVQQLDNRIGEGYMDLSLEWRLEDAAREETPWRFSYILTGGERRSRARIAALRDEERADLLLAAIAAGQLVSSDRGASREWLEIATQVFGRNASWLSNSLKILRDRHLITGDEWVQCIHQRFAAVALESIYQYREVAWLDLTRMLRTAIVFREPSLNGVFSMLSALRARSGFPSSGTGIETVIDDNTWQLLINRCWSAGPGHERRSAISIVSELLEWHPATLNAIGQQTHLLGDWLESADADTAGRLMWLLNNLGNKNALNVIADICNHADPSVIAASVSSARWSELYAWGALLGRFWRAPERWRYELLSSFDVNALHALVESVPAGGLEHLDQLLLGLFSLDKELALSLLEPAITKLANAVNANPAFTFRSIDEIVGRLFGYPPAAFMRVPITAQQKRLAQLFARSLEVNSIAAAISNSRRRDWRTHAELLVFLQQTARKQAQAVVDTIDFETLDYATQGMWQSPPRELEELISALDIDRANDENQARSWIKRHAKEYGRLDATLARMAPEEAVSRLRDGESLNLEFAHGAWVRAFLALASISKLDEALTRRVLNDNRQGLSEGLVKVEAWDSKIVEVFVRALQKGLPDELTAALSIADPEKARQNWTTLLRGNAKQKQAAAAILQASEAVVGPIASVIQDLKRKFPRSSAFLARRKAQA